MSPKAPDASQEPDLQLDEVCPAPFREWACGLTKGHLGACQDAEPAWFRAWRRSTAIQRAIRAQEKRTAALTSAEAQRLRD